MSRMSWSNARWRDIQALQPVFLFADSLPTTEDAHQDCQDPLKIDGRIDLQDEIAMLRAELRFNIIRQQQIDIDDFDNDDANADADADLEWLGSSLQTLLQDLELLIDPKILQLGGLERTLESESLACFPRLRALRQLLQKEDKGPPLQPPPDNSTAQDNSDTADPTGTNAANAALHSSHGRRFFSTSAAEAVSYICFPRDFDKLRACRIAMCQFGMAMERIIEDWTPEAQMQDYTSHDVEAIRRAHEFASACTSLFIRMAGKGNTNCGSLHRARLQLSGFKRDQLDVKIGTCQESDWISAVFTRSLDRPSTSTEMVFADHMCSPALSNVQRCNVLHVAFNSEGTWITSQEAGLGSRDVFIGEESLDYHLTHKGGLTRKHRKLTGVLLAASLFQLNDGPWFEQHLGPECIFVPSSSSNKRMQQWCPRIHCTLVPRQDPSLLSDNIAALGVLIMELEADRKSDWNLEDEELVSGIKSNHVRLARMLNKWRDDVSDDCRRIAKACLDFDNLTQALDHSDIAAECKGLAIIYKYILEPLLHDILTSFGDVRCLVEGVLGSSRSLDSSVNIPSTVVNAKRVLFDDYDTTPKHDDQQSAKKFLDDLKSFFNDIRALRQENLGSREPQHEKIRIVVLDSGVDDTHPMMRSAIGSGRINGQSKSFVGRADDWRQDTYGHGTHVMQLILKTAPAAEVYVGKICTDKVINAEQMAGIAEAINWAVEKCKANVISMSFGFEEEDDVIDAALENALRANTLLIAAASNNGGLSGRARPARRDGVVCIHATDGKGNKGSMNPTPLPNRDNFATLGVAVPSRWKGDDVWKSGTSFAAPVAVGFAADVLEFALHRCHLTPLQLKALHQKRGMEAVFRRMAVQRDGYDFVHPFRIWEDRHDDTRRNLGRKAAAIIEDTMKSL